MRWPREVLPLYSKAAAWHFALFGACLLLGACATTTASQIADGGLRLSGKAQAVENGCYYDAVCTVTVNGTVVETMSGRRLGPTPVWGHSDGQPQVGQNVEVFCRRTGANTCTLEGDPGYFLRHVK